MKYIAVFALVILAIAAAALAYQLPEVTANLARIEEAKAERAEAAVDLQNAFNVRDGYRSAITAWQMLLFTVCGGVCLLIVAAGVHSGVRELDRRLMTKPSQNPYMQRTTRRQLQGGEYVYHQPIEHYQNEYVDGGYR